MPPTHRQHRSNRSAKSAGQASQAKPVLLERICGHLSTHLDEGLTIFTRIPHLVAACLARSW